MRLRGTLLKNLTPPFSKLENGSKGDEVGTHRITFQTASESENEHKNVVAIPAVRARPFLQKGLPPTIITLNVRPFISRYNLGNSDALKFSEHL